MSDEISQIKEEEEQEMLNSEASPRALDRRRGDNRWLGGVVLIGIGLYLLLGNIFSFALFGNWWAIFILIPAFYSFQRAWQAYKLDGTVSRKVRSNLIGGMMIGAVGVIFLFGLNFGRWWPAFLIIAGFGILLRRVR
jgi:hypothetical protein